MLFVVSLALLACSAYAGQQQVLGPLTSSSGQSVILNGGASAAGLGSGQTVVLNGGSALSGAGLAGEYVSGAALPAGAGYATEYVSGGAVLPGGALTGGYLTGGALSGGYLAGGALSGGYLAGGALSGGAVVSGPVVSGGVQNVYAEHAHVVPGQEIVYKVRSAPKVQKHVALAAQVIRQPKYYVTQPKYNVLRQVVPSPVVDDVTVVQEPKPHVVDVVPQVHKETVVVDTPTPKPQIFLSQRRRKTYAKKVDVDQHKITHHSGSGDVTVEDVKRLLDAGKFDGPNVPQKVTYTVNGVPQATQYNTPAAVAPTTYINTAPAAEIAVSGAIAPAAEVAVSGAIAPAAEVISTGPAVYSAGAPAGAVYTADAPAATIYSSGAPAATVISSGAPAATYYSSAAPAATVYSSGAPAATVYSSGAPAVEVSYGQGSNGASLYSLSGSNAGNGQGSTSISFQGASGSGSSASGSSASTGSAKPFLFGSSSNVNRVGTKH